MNMITRNPKTNKIQYHNYVAEIMFSDIFERTNNVEELRFIIQNLCASMEVAANDWYSDNVEPYVDPFCIDYNSALEDEKE